MLKYILCAINQLIICPTFKIALHVLIFIFLKYRKTIPTYVDEES